MHRYARSVAFELQMLQEYDKKRKIHGILRVNGTSSLRCLFKIALLSLILRMYLDSVFTFSLPPFQSIGGLKRQVWFMCLPLPPGFGALRSCIFAFTLLQSWLENSKLPVYVPGERLSHVWALCQGQV